MRALAPLPAFLLLAASAAACPFGFPGHSHVSVEQAAPAAPMPEGKCTGQGTAPTPAPVPAGGPPFDLRTAPIPAQERVYWEMIGYRIDDAASRRRDAQGAVVTQAEMDALQKPFDAATQRLDAVLWQTFVLSGYQLDESSCLLMGRDSKPLNTLTMRVWREAGRRHQAHSAMETLLAKLQGLDPALPLPDDVRKHMLAVGQAGTELPPRIKELLKRAGTTVGQLRAPATASYADSTKFFDGQRPLADVALAAVPGSGSGTASRRKGIPDPDERVLGATLSAAFNAEMAKTAPGRELLARFRGPNGPVLPDVMVLKLTQSPNDPQIPGAVYDSSADRMIINHWSIVRSLHAGLPPEKLAKIKDRLADAKQISKLLKEDPSLIPVLIGNIDVMYFHELTHAAQSRRNRMDDEAHRGNLPGANPLALEHEAHREHCRYLLSKDPASIDRSDWRDYCMGIIRDPDAFKDGVTSRYLSTFSGSSRLEDLASRQEVRRRTARSLESSGGVVNWLVQKLKQVGYGLGDTELTKYRTDVDRREKEFLAGIPALRREAGGALLEHYEKTGAPHRALATALAFPPGTLAGGPARLDALADKTAAWVARAGDPAQRDDRLSAVALLGPRYAATGRAWPLELIAAYERDARSMAEELLAKALRLPRERDELLDRASSWVKALQRPGDLPERIARARGERPK